VLGQDPRNGALFVFANLDPPSRSLLAHQINSAETIDNITDADADAVLATEGPHRQ